MIQIYNLVSITNTVFFFLRNPVGRTGMVGRGLLGRWGPNHAADPLVTRYTLLQLHNRGRRWGGRVTPLYYTSHTPSPHLREEKDLFLYVVGGGRGDLNLLELLIPSIFSSYIFVLFYCTHTGGVTTLLFTAGTGNKLLVF